MTAIDAVATYLPRRRTPVPELPGPLGLTSMQVSAFQRHYELAEIRRDPHASLLDLLLAAASNLTGLRGQEHRVRYVLHARSFPVVVPFPINPLHELCARLGLGHTVAFAVNHHACATGLLALDVAGRLLAADPDPAVLALVLTGEKAFTRDAQLVAETTTFAEGAAACLVSTAGPRDRLRAYAANLRGEFDDELAGDPAAYQREYPAALADAMLAAVACAGLRLDQIELVLPHNINTLVWRRLCRRIDYPVTKVLLDNVPTVGHTFCADAFFNYRSAVDRGLLRPGAHYLVAAAGAGRGAAFSAMVFTH